MYRAAIELPSGALVKIMAMESGHVTLSKIFEHSQKGRSYYYHEHTPGRAWTVGRKEGGFERVDPCRKIRILGAF